MKKPKSHNPKYPLKGFRVLGPYLVSDDAQAYLDLHRKNYGAKSV